MRTRITADQEGTEAASHKFELQSRKATRKEVREKKRLQEKKKWKKK